MRNLLACFMCFLHTKVKKLLQKTSKINLFSMAGMSLLVVKANSLMKYNIRSDFRVTNVLQPNLKLPRRFSYTVTPWSESEYAIWIQI